MATAVRPAISEQSRRTQLNGLDRLTVTQDSSLTQFGRPGHLDDHQQEALDTFKKVIQDIGTRARPLAEPWARQQELEAEGLYQPGPPPSHTEATLL